MKIFKKYLDMVAAECTMEKYEKLLNMLMEFNPLVRFTAVCSTSGDIEWSSQRDNVTNIIPLEETNDRKRVV